MLTAERALNLHYSAEPMLPQPSQFAPLWNLQSGVKPRVGQLIMIAGRPGHFKSGLALCWVNLLNLPTLYVSADMTPFEATGRLACMRNGLTMEEVEQRLNGPREDKDRILQSIRDAPITFSFDNPIRLDGIETELEAYVELHNAYPRLLVVDNMMDFQDAESDYSVQMAVMQELISMGREYGITVILLHHATDKSGNALALPGLPPSRAEIKNGLAEKPQLTLTVALEPTASLLRVAPVKQRGGFADQSGKTYAEFALDGDRYRIYPRNGSEGVWM